MKTEPSTPLPLSNGLINSIVEQQLATWPLAYRNFMQLAKAERHNMILGALKGSFQHNPARIKSTGAAVDKKSIESRRCFLCATNRPSEQMSISWAPGWELLVNPYPILPIHFTIVSTEHVPQDEVPLDMASMAEAAPDLVIFYNGAKAGASAPDHKHLQAVLKMELPLLALAEKYHPVSQGGFISSEDMGIDLPFHFVSGVITPDLQGMQHLALVPGSFGIDKRTGQRDKGLVNVFFWMSSEGILRCIIIPRRAHRPECWASTNENERFIISPGAIDMTGLMIAPRREDFDRLNSEKAAAIYAEVAFKDGLPEDVRQYFDV